MPLFSLHLITGGPKNATQNSKALLEDGQMEGQISPRISLLLGVYRVSKNNYS